MKIVFATDSYWPRINGMSVSIDTFKQSLEAAGHEVHVLAPAFPGEPEDADQKAGRRNVHRFESTVWWLSKEDPLVHLSELPAVHQLLERLRPDVVHVQTELAMGWMCWRWARANQVPLVMTCHTFWQDYISHYAPFIPPRVSCWLVRTVTRRIARNMDAVVAPTDRMRNVLLRYGVDAPIDTIPTGFQQASFCGVDREQERRDSPLFEKHPELKGRKVLLTVGRLGKEKNHDFLVEVMEQLRTREPDALWLVVGDGPYRAELEARLVARGLRDRCVFTGYLPRDRVKHAFALADVFMFASKTETQGLVTVEAMSLGTPVVAIGEMGTRDVMNGDNGGFMMREEVGPFADRVSELLSDPALHAAKSAEAMSYAKRWTSCVLTERLVGVYQSVSRQLPACAHAPELAA
ncbi:MAG: glycosyltransferase [Myxococcaceae bacterium]|nr:glycosyltransferase [Myxococcaceae bacterium]MCI0672151.1 glycosyltransferase [Myxococcaceae bacterium]